MGHEGDRERKDRSMTKQYLITLFSFIVAVVGVCVIAYAIYILPNKGIKGRRRVFEHAVCFVNRVHKTGRIPAPFGQDTYKKYQEYIYDYMYKNGILQCEVYDPYQNSVVIVDLQKTKEILRPAPDRVTTVLQAMNHDDVQIANVLRKAEVQNGKGIMQNYDELLRFAMKEVGGA